MKVELHDIKIGELCEGYVNSDEEGVFGYHGALDIRPPYQREFVYNDAQQQAVINTVLKGFPLNIMYWARRNDGRYEVMDGQQRTLSICEYVAGHFSANIEGHARFFHNLPKDQQEKILSYALMVYFCEGEDSEKLSWFQTVNIAGERLTQQELLNAVYAGPWTTDAKRKFSKTNCVAYRLGNKLLKGSTIRQDYLETALQWITKNDVEKYMSEHQNDPNANALWAYFRNVIDWVNDTFRTYRKEMKGIDWGTLYDNYHEELLNTDDLENKISNLMADDDVTNKKGIYFYILTRDEKYLNVRAFTPSMKRAAYTRQKGICNVCKKHFKFEEMEGDHITPWSQGGKTEIENCQMLCKACNRRKSNV